MAQRYVTYVPPSLTSRRNGPVNNLHEETLTSNPWTVLYTCVHNSMLHRGRSPVDIAYAGEYIIFCCNEYSRYGLDHT